MDESRTAHDRQQVVVNLYRTSDRVIVAAPMPGLRPEDVTVEVTASGRLILQSKPRGVLRDQLFNVQVTDDRDGDGQVWTHEQWQDRKDVVLNEWNGSGYYRELDLPVAVDAALGTVTYGNGVLVVVLPVTELVRPGQIQLRAMEHGRGEHVGSRGHPVQPLAGTVQVAMTERSA